MKATDDIMSIIIISLYLLKPCYFMSYITHSNNSSISGSAFYSEYKLPFLVNRTMFFCRDLLLSCSFTCIWQLNKKACSSVLPPLLSYRSCLSLLPCHSFIQPPMFPSVSLEWIQLHLSVNQMWNLRFWQKPAFYRRIIWKQLARCS